MFAAMTPPLKSDGAQQSGGVETTPPSLKIAWVAIQPS
jgi:hypothetical protein